MNKIYQWILRQVIKFICSRYAAAHCHHAKLQVEWLNVLDFNTESRYPDILYEHLIDAKQTELYWLTLLHKVTTYANTIKNN